MMSCAECFILGVLCGAMLAAAAIVVAVACVWINRPQPAMLPDKDSVLE
jgi:hypothetical protein